MKIRLIAIALLFGAAGLGQVVEHPLGGLVEGYKDAIRLKMEAQTRQAQENLMNAQAAAIRQQTEQLRLQAEKLKQQPTAEPLRQLPPEDALCADPEFNRLPMATRIRFVKLVAPQLAKYSDEDLAAVLTNVAAKILAPAK
jgi:Sec-independent protein translocase protein TatA